MSQKRELIYYIPNIESNKKDLQYVHDVTSLTLGIGSGILTLESYKGFLLYIFGYTAVNLIFYFVCCNKKAASFFRKPFHEIFLEDILSDMPGFVMMWCLTYALVR
ncbi:Piso0_002535 [Millerozyma farinosa CBS 7064]|uniref:ER membrane protein complex subunit 6 n=1 Tax=Pichia sorbitophila (strain ATCC MYA-4447 / BCRC 22081 / CBS 7064 / NBRC 10061 / NRRL Y-12695) TaxID=559304 RepID=G8YFA9_PICSO|nr:Piso0_002535 [Millerozyma farinosa CBS 7064]